MKKRTRAAAALILAVGMVGAVAAPAQAAYYGKNCTSTTSDVCSLYFTGAGTVATIRILMNGGGSSYWGVQNRNLDVTICSGYIPNDGAWHTVTCFVSTPAELYVVKGNRTGQMSVTT